MGVKMKPESAADRGLGAQQKSDIQQETMKRNPDPALTENGSSQRWEF